MHTISAHEPPIVLRDGEFELRMREEGDLIVNFVEMPAGAGFAEPFSHLGGGRCQCRGARSMSTSLPRPNSSN